MKKICFAVILALLVAGLTACAQNVGAPSGGSGVSGESSAGSSVATSSEATSSSALAPEQKIKADSSSVILRMPSEVRFGETATATIVNNSSYEISYGAQYTFQYFVDGAWVDLEPLEGKERMWIAIAYITQPGEEAAFDFVIYPDEFTVALKPGEYRLVKNVTADNDGESASFEITGTFTAK